MDREPDFRLPLSKLGLLSHFSRVRLLGTQWTAVRQAPLSVEFSRQEYWSGLPFPTLGDLPNPGIEPMSPTLQADSLATEKAPTYVSYHIIIVCLVIIVNTY